MKMLIVSCLIALSTQLLGQVSGSFKTGVKSEYLGRVGAIFSEDPVIISCLELDYQGGYLGVWNSTGTTHRRYGITYADEWDLFGGYGRDVGPVHLDVSASYFGLAELSHMSDDMWIAEQELSVPQCPFVTPYIRSRYFGSVDEGWKPGWFVFGGVRKSITLFRVSNRPIVANVDFSTAYAAGAIRDFTGFVYGRGLLEVSVPISSKVSFVPEILYQVAAPGNRNDPNSFTHSNELVGGCSLRVKF